MIDQLIKHLPTIDPENIKEFYEERAGVREFDGGMPKSLAERYAFQDTIDHFYIVNHIKATSTI